MQDDEAAERRSAIVLDLFDRYYDRVYVFARRSVGPDVAEDATQEAFLRLLKHPRLEELEISVSYLLRVVQNILRRRHTRTVRLREILEREVVPAEKRKAGGIKPVYERPQSRASIQQVDLDRAMNRLSDDERDTIRLVVCEGLSYAEAARSLGVSVTTVNNWRHRGLARLRGVIDADRVLGGDLSPKRQRGETG
jgi:RNA polymerase sigma-70 factor (ECF subfamily)